MHYNALMLPMRVLCHTLQGQVALGHMELQSKMNGRLEFDEFWLWLTSKGGLLSG